MQMSSCSQLCYRGINISIEVSLIIHNADFTPNNFQKNNNKWLVKGKQSSTVAKARGKMGMAVVNKSKELM